MVCPYLSAVGLEIEPYLEFIWPQIHLAQKNKPSSNLRNNIKVVPLALNTRYISIHEHTENLMCSI